MLCNYVKLKGVCTKNRSDTLKLPSADPTLRNYVKFKGVCTKNESKTFTI
jgi:hypothetical protein